MLIALFRVCREGGCGASVDLGNIKLSWKGGCLNVVATCNSNHVTKVDFLLLPTLVNFYHLQWSSSPLLGVGKFCVPVINILIGTYSFLTALHIEQVSLRTTNTDISECYF